MYRGQAEEGPRLYNAYQRLGDDQDARQTNRLPRYSSRDEPSAQPAALTRIRPRDLSRHSSYRALAEDNGSLLPVQALPRERAQNQDLVIRTRHTILDPRAPSSDRSASSTSTRPRKSKSAVEDAEASASKKKAEATSKLEKHGGLAGLVLIGAAGIAGLNLLNKARHQYYDDPLETRKGLMQHDDNHDDHHHHDDDDDEHRRHHEMREPQVEGYVHDDDFHRELEKSRVYNGHEHGHHGPHGSLDESFSDTATMSSLASSIDERRIQRLKGKQQRMTGFALVATVNATNRMYQGAKKRRQRREALADGTMTPEEASRKKRMDGIQNAASIIAAGASIRAAMMKSREAKALRQERADYHRKKAEYAELKAEHHARALERRRSAHSSPRSTPESSSASPQSRHFA